uniref:Peptidase S74 domain-containing protein n=1 Tax=Alexandrium catenella TaxID=2925 RepID=A0A7S1RR68_ALECA
MFSLSVMEYTNLGSSLSLRGFMRFGSQVSVFSECKLGSSLSLRAISRLGSRISLCGISRIGSSLSVVHTIGLGSTLSLRTFMRFGSSISVMDFSHIGSSLSVRQWARIGSTLSLFGLGRLGSTLSIVDYLHVGSSLSVRGFVRLGAGLSMVGGMTANPLYFNSNTYFKENSGVVEAYVGGTKALTLESDGGILHGSWNSESVLVTSDRRLKRDITPLQRTLRSAMPGRDAVKPKGLTKVGEGAGAASGGDGALWLLRQLRPVSYSFRKGGESKYMRFGFIADELESVVPQVVRTVGDREVSDQKAVVYQDLIALLAAAAQGQAQAVEDLKKNMEVQLEELRAQLDVLNHQKKEQELGELRALRAEIERMKQARNETAELEELRALRHEVERLKQEDEMQAGKGSLPEQDNTSRERTALRGT